MKFNILYLSVLGLMAAQFTNNVSSGPVPDVGFSGPPTISRIINGLRYPRDCQEVYEQNKEGNDSGIYTIQPDNSPAPFNVYCNNSIDWGKWTVFQRRVSGSVDFYRNWDEYKYGFGCLDGDFWLGNDNLAYLTSQKKYELRIDMNNVDGEPYFAKYSFFRISDEERNYKLGLGTYLTRSTANDAMAYHRNMSFTTFDRDNDRVSDGNCANSSFIGGAWWYNRCSVSNLNGFYFDCPYCHQSITWHNLTGGSYNIKYVEMKVRPTW